MRAKRLLFSIMIVVCHLIGAQQSFGSVTSDQLKSVYVYKLIKFITWDEKNSSNRPFSLCLYTDKRGLINGFKQIDGLATHAGTIQLRIVDYTFLTDYRRLNSCRFIYIGRDIGLDTFIEQQMLGGNALMITEDEHTGRSLGDINLRLDQNKLTIQISRNRERELKVKFGATLLLFASAVY